MIDPGVPDMGGLNSETDRQEFLLFCIAVAGKESSRTKAALNMLLIELLQDADTMKSYPFDLVEWAAGQGVLGDYLRRSKIGQYTRIERAFTEVARRFNLNTTEIPKKGARMPLERITVQQLESVPGIGPKTARYFVQYAQGRTDVAAIDTHLLKWLRDLGYEAPSSTPPAGPKYRTCEAAFLHECEKRGVNPVDMDFKVWSTYRSGGRVA